MKAQNELIAAIERYRSGDQNEFERIYNLSYKYLYVCIRHIVKEEETANDMLQETYLEVSKSIDQLKNAEDFLNWAAVIAKRKCFAYLNKAEKLVVTSVGENGEEREILDEIADDEAFIPESIIQDQEKSRLMREIIDGLSDMQRLCIIGYYYNEQRQEEIAEELGIPVNTVKSHLNRAKTKIREEVLTLEREKDTKLYALAPFMLLFFAEEAEACEYVPHPDFSAFKPSKAAKAGLKMKMIIGAVLVTGAVAAVVVINSMSGKEEGTVQETAEEAEVLQETAEEADAFQETEAVPEEEEETESTLAGEASAEQEEEAAPETAEEPKELAISGVYDELGLGKDGIIVACSKDQWGLVTYDNEVLVPLQYAYACSGPNDDGQTFFGNEGDYRVFNREGQEIFQTEKPIKAVSEGVVLWVEVEEGIYRFGYVELDGTVLYESTGEDVEGQAGAVGFNGGYAFSSNGNQGTEDRISLDGTVMDIFKERTVLRHPELLEDPAASSMAMSTGDGSEGSIYYPVGANYQGYYVDRGIDFFEDSRGQFYVYDAEGTEQYLLRLESVADHAGFSWWEDESLRWSIKGFYHNGNYCYSNGTVVGITMSSGEESKGYLIDTAKLEEGEGGYGSTVTDSAVLFEGEYVWIDDSACFRMQQDGQYGYVDHDGNVLAVFDDVSSFYNGSAMVIKDGYACFIDEDMTPGEWKIPAESVTGCGEVYSVMTEDGEKCFVAE